jgi:hypothetical protein
VGAAGLTLRPALEEFVAAGVLPGAAVELFDDLRRRYEARGSGRDLDPSDPHRLVSAFFHAGRAVTSARRPGWSPCDHNRLVLRVVNGTGGRLAVECAVQKYHACDDDRDAPMTVLFVHRDRVYEFCAENHGDWYDVGAVAATVNIALADAGHRERFMHSQSEDQCPVFVFADPAAFLPIATRYSVPVDDDTAAAMAAGVAYEQDVTGRTSGSDG